MPCDYSKYPPNFRTEIRPRILARAGNKCERCGVPNYAEGYREKDGTFVESTGMQADTDALDGKKIIKIVLTIAHLENPDPMDCRDENLAALCQMHHLQLDAKQHGRNAAATRARNKRRAIEAAGQLAINLE